MSSRPADRSCPIPQATHRIGAARLPPPKLRRWNQNPGSRRTCQNFPFATPSRRSIRIYKEAYRIAQATGQFFGYLDHPFSDRYAYGWASEAERQRIHGELLDFMDVECTQAPLLFVNEETCLDFMLEKSDTGIVFDE